MQLTPLRAAFLPLLFSLALASAAFADVITGRVVSSTGTGLAGVNIDAVDTNGDPVDLANDGTDSSGNFTTTILAGPGIYTFRFFPPPPPASTHVALELVNVVVSGTKNLSTLTLAAGVSLSGRTIKTGNIPVANVSLVVIDGLSDLPVLLGQLKTNSFGQFNVAVPTHAIELRLDATSSGQALASKAVSVSPMVNTALGDQLLPAGFTVSGRVRTSAGNPVGGVDLDFALTSTGAGAYTPGDNTNGSGDFSVVVAAGTYDIEFCPKLADPLVGTALLGRVVSGTTNLGTVTLQNGVTLSGIIRDAGSNPVLNADVDAQFSPNGAPVVLCHDNSDAAGAYSVRVPTGTLDIHFSPPGCKAPAAQDHHLNVVISGNTTLNGTLPALPGASSSTFSGDGINADTVAPLNAVVGSSWSAPLTIGHTHGASGALSLKIRTSTFNGPNFISAIGGRLTETLITGPFLSVIPGGHNGVTGNIAPQSVPNNSSLVGVGWAAQYTVVGGGFADLSRAVFGVVGCQ